MATRVLEGTALYVDGNIPNVYKVSYDPSRKATHVHIIHRFQCGEDMDSLEERTHVACCNETPAFMYPVELEYCSLECSMDRCATCLKP